MKDILSLVLTILVVAVSCMAVVYAGPLLIALENSRNEDNSTQTAAALNSSDFNLERNLAKNIDFLDFNENASSSSRVLKETGQQRKSANINWWLNSGAYLTTNSNGGATVLGDLPTLDPWRVAYSISNPLDTDTGYHPQNIFRLVYEGLLENYVQEAYFKVSKLNASNSPNRNASNGLLFFNRYQDEFNLYYAGLRVDGYAVIKKKINSTYYTLAYERVIGGLKYDRTTNPNLIPENVWIGLRSVVKTTKDNTVSIQLFVDIGKMGEWKLALEALDDGRSYGGHAFLGPGNVGIRTDFMDVSFNNYKLEKLDSTELDAQ